MPQRPPHERSDNPGGGVVPDLATDDVTPMEKFLRFARALTKVSKEELAEQELKEKERKSEERA